LDPKPNCYYLCHIVTTYLVGDKFVLPILDNSNKKYIIIKKKPTIYSMYSRLNQTYHNNT